MDVSPLVCAHWSRRGEGKSRFVRSCHSEAGSFLNERIKELLSIGSYRLQPPAAKRIKSFCFFFLKKRRTLLNNHRRHMSLLGGQREILIGQPGLRNELLKRFVLVPPPPRVIEILIEQQHRAGHNPPA